MTNNINDLKKFIGNKMPLKANNMNKIKEAIKSVDLKKDEEQVENTSSNSFIEKNSPSEILGRSQVKNKKSKNNSVDNFENDMNFISNNYKTVSLANDMFDKFLQSGYSYAESSLLSNQFVKELSWFFVLIIIA